MTEPKQSMNHHPRCDDDTNTTESFTTTTSVTTDNNNNSSITSKDTLRHDDGHNNTTISREMTTMTITCSKRRKLAITIDTNVPEKKNNVDRYETIRSHQLRQDSSDDDDDTSNGSKSSLKNNHRIRKRQHLDNITPFSTPIAIDSIEDLFLQILRYFVSPSGLVDGKSIRNIMHVSKRWYRLSNMTNLWMNDIGCGSGDDGKGGRMIRHVCIAQPQPVISPPDSPINNNTNDHLPPSPTHHSSNRRSINDYLIGYTKLRPLLRGINDNGIDSVLSFAVRDRATARLYILKIPRIVFRQKEEEEEDVDAQPSTVMREFTCLYRFSSLSSTSSKENSDMMSLCLPSGVALFEGNILRWYNYIPHSIADCLHYHILQTLSSSSQSPSSTTGSIIPPMAVKRLLYQLLRAVKILHEQGFIHCQLQSRKLRVSQIVLSSGENTTTTKEGIIDYSNAMVTIGDFSQIRRSFPSSSMCDFKRQQLLSQTASPPSSPSYIVEAPWNYPPECLLGDNAEGCTTPSVDIWSVGCIFVEMVMGRSLFRGGGECAELMKVLRGGKEEEVKESVDEEREMKERREASKNGEIYKLQKLVPSLDPIGIDLLSKLLNLDPKKRITASAALSHPYFTSLNPPPKEFTQPQSPPPPSSLHYDPHVLVPQLQSIEATIPRHPRRNHATEDQWACIVDWITEIVDVFDKGPRTAFLAMSLFDRFLACVKKFKSFRYQLVAATCLHIASKCEDDTPIPITDLVFSADNTFTIRHIRRLEHIILKSLDYFKLSTPVIFDFTSLYIEGMEEFRGEEKMRWMAMYIGELALQSGTFIKYQPSIVAAAVVSLTLQSSLSSTTPPTTSSYHASLETISGYNQDSLNDCIKVLCTSIERIRTTLPQLKMISKRYKKRERGGVAEGALTVVSRISQEQQQQQQQRQRR